MSNTTQNRQANKPTRGNAGEANARLKQTGTALLGEQAAEQRRPSLPISTWGGLRSIKHREWATRTPTPTAALLTHTDRGGDAAGQLAVPRGELVMFVGAGGLGKSMATMQLAIAVTTGKNWLGFAPAAPGGVVVLICAEDNENTMHARFVACTAAMNLRADEVSRAEALIVPLPGDDGVPKLVKHCFGEAGEVIDEGEDMAQLTNELRHIGEASAEGLALIILDPSVKFMPAEGEERAAVASRFVDELKNWTRTLPGQPTVMLVHHTTKSARKEGGYTAEAARGSSSLTDSVRCQLNLFDMANNKGAGPRLASSEQSAEQLYLCISKSNYGPMGYAMPLMRNAATGALGLADRDHDIEDNKPNKDSSKGSKGPKGSKGSSIPNPFSMGG